jgi:hypothetical protein
MKTVPHVTQRIAAVTCAWVWNCASAQGTWHARETVPPLLSMSASTVAAIEPALYRLLPLQTMTPVSGWHGYAFRLGDIDDDGKSDIVWNNRCQRPVGPGGCVTSANYVASARSLGNGAFTQTLAYDISNGGSGWDTYEWFVGDVGGDGKADIVWNSIQGDATYAFVGVSNGDGTFTLGGVQTLGLTGYQNRNQNVGDFNGDGRLDLYWGTVCSFANGINSCSVGDTNSARVALATSSNTFLVQSDQTFLGSGWSDYNAYFGDVNGDGKTDVVYNTTEQGSGQSRANYVYVGLSNGNGAFDLKPLQVIWPSGTDYFQTLLGDVNGDGKTDLIWVSNYQSAGDANLVYVGLSNGDGTFGVTQQQALGASAGWQSYVVSTGDVNGDGKDDLIYNSTNQGGGGSANYVYVAVAGDNGLLTLSPLFTLGSAGWSVYRSLIGDIDGDGRADIVWNSTYQSNVSDANYVYVGRSLPDRIFRGLFE